MPIIKGPFRLFVYDYVNRELKTYIANVMHIVTYNQYTSLEADHYFCNVTDENKSKTKIKYEVNRVRNKLFTHNSRYITMITREPDVETGTKIFIKELNKYYTEEISYAERSISELNDKIQESLAIINDISTNLKVDNDDKLGE